MTFAVLAPFPPNNKTAGPFGAGGQVPYRVLVGHAFPVKTVERGLKRGDLRFEFFLSITRLLFLSRPHFEEARQSSGRTRRSGVSFGKSDTGWGVMGYLGGSGNSSEYWTVPLARGHAYCPRHFGQYVALDARRCQFYLAGPGHRVRPTASPRR